MVDAVALYRLDQRAATRWTEQIHGHCGETSATDFVGTAGPTDPKHSAGGKVRQVLLPDIASRFAPVLARRRLARTIAYQTAGLQAQSRQCYAVESK